MLGRSPPPSALRPSLGTWAWEGRRGGLTAVRQRRVGQDASCLLVLHTPPPRAPAVCKYGMVARGDADIYLRWAAGREMAHTQKQG